MTTVNVTKWSEIVTAITEAIDDITINITQNINLIGEFIYGVTSSIEIPEYINVIIEGNNHKIINLTNDLSLTDGIFITDTESHSKITIQNVNFVNTILNNLALIKSNNADDELEVINCGFVGKRNGTSYLFDVPQAKFTSCFFDIPWIGTGQNPQKYTSLVTNPTGSSGTTTYVTNYEAEYCWFREHYTNWAIKTWSYTNVNSTTNSTLWSFFFIKLNGCYIDGDMTISTDTHSGHTNNIPIVLTHYPNAKTFIPTKMNVFDVDVTCVGTKTTADYGVFFGLYINKLYNENDELITNWTIGYDLSTSGNYPLPIIATETEAANESWLRDHGFAV